MTMKMAALQPEEIIVKPKETSHEMEEKGDCGPGSPDAVDGLSPMPMPMHAEDESDESESNDSGSESEEEEEGEDEEAMPDGDTNDDLHALLQFSKSRLEKTPQPPPTAEPTPTQADEEEEEEEEEEEDGEDEEDDEDTTSDNENSEDVVGVGNASEGDINSNDKSTVDEHLAINRAHSEEKKTDIDVAAPPAAPSQIKDQAYYIELAMKKANKARRKAKQDEDESYLLKLAEQKTREAELRAKQDKDESYLLELAERKRKEAEIKAKQDEDPDYLRKIAEKKVKEALAKAKEDEVATAEGAARRRPSAKPRRDENAELWALLNYSQRRLETGSTPQVKKRSSVVRGDDVSVSSKLSKSSKRSLNSKNSKSSVKKAAPVGVVDGPGDVALEGGPGDATQPKGPAELTDANDEDREKTDAPVPDVTGNGEDSVDGSVSSESGAKASDESYNSDDDDDDDESSDEESDEEEDELPDFLNDFGEDPEEAKMLYEAAKFKAASILSVSEEKLTDVQMLQAIAIAEDAARKGDDKFSTKRSLFKLNEAKIDDLKSFLSLSIGPKKSQQKKSLAKKEEVAWGIGGGRFFKKIGAVCRDFKEKCDEIDSKLVQEKAEKPSGVEMVQAGMQDLKAQIEEYEKIMTATKKKGKEAMSRSLNRN